MTGPPLPSATPAQARRRPPRARRSFAARLFGYDLFISVALGHLPQGSAEFRDHPLARFCLGIEVGAQRHLHVMQRRLDERSDHGPGGPAVQRCDQLARQHLGDHLLQHEGIGADVVARA